MTRLNILQQRLYNQQVTHQSFKEPGEVVAWLGAVQAQDYHAFNITTKRHLKIIAQRMV